MTLAESARAAARLLLEAGHPAEDSRRDVALLARAVLGWSLTKWLADQHSEAPGRFDSDLRVLAARRARGEPIAYITGEREFYGRPFRVSPAVLIPRPETEILVEEALVELDAHPAADPPLVIDVGTGSGCIAMSIAMERPHARVVATDISTDALDVARENAVALGVADRVEFRAGDLLAGIADSPTLIVSNPPYVAESDRLMLPPDVRFEPEGALFGGIDGLDVIRELVRVAAEKLAPGGALLMEIGAGQAPDVTRLIQRTPELTLERMRVDLQSIPRVVRARRHGRP